MNHEHPSRIQADAVRFQVALIEALQELGFTIEEVEMQASSTHERIHDFWITARLPAGRQRKEVKEQVDTLGGSISSVHTTSFQIEGDQTGTGSKASGKPNAIWKIEATLELAPQPVDPR